ncbi:MAG: hypothetical protein MJZ52_07180 [Bacteroidales bacterium]|nr:hypothetical protein [Bacteroidales bacterium]
MSNIDNARIDAQIDNLKSDTVHVEAIDEDFLVECLEELKHHREFITPMKPTINTDNIAEAFQNIAAALVEIGKAVTDVVNAIANTIGNITNDVFRAYITNDVFRAYIIKTCPNKRWVQMAFHAKKFRVRKKYMNKIIKHYYDDEVQMRKRALNYTYGLEAKA